tara:strand:+ start:2980 stop:3204 length:225 start_codon:yes stop_codon:yes gene_type:complete
MGSSAAKEIATSNAQGKGAAFKAISFVGQEPVECYVMTAKTARMHIARFVMESTVTILPHATCNASAKVVVEAV